MSAEITPLERFVSAVGFVARAEGSILRLTGGDLEIGDLWVRARNDEITVREITHLRFVDGLALIRYEDALGIAKGETSIHLTTTVIVLRDVP